jgi:hypothetical protein
VPAYLEAEDVLNPTDSVKAELDTLLREEIAKYPAEVNNAAVVFTKNGELIYPEVERTETDGWSDNRLGFHAAGEFLNQPGSWDAAYWHAYVPTGVYIYRLQAGDRVAVKKVVVAK